jgi:hypothetical protein
MRQRAASVAGHVQIHPWKACEELQGQKEKKKGTKKKLFF